MFQDIPISPDIDRKYKQYSLSAYSEGILSEKVRRMKFTGIPVLFIPGHSGSGKQVRSIASVALRKSVDESHLQFHFDFFSVDFNGEYSALFGGVLDAQTRYVAHSLHKILTLYQPHRQPVSVVIIGHSMGGMIAKGLYLLDGFDPSLISTIITLATPHEPVVLLDTYLHDYYTKVNRFWSTYNHENTSIVSIGGGNADIHVRASLTKTDHVDICTSSSMIPAVWVGADHKSMVWCKRLIKVLVRILFDSVDPHTKHISTNVHHRNSVLKYHLSERFGGKSYRMAQNLGSQIFSSEGQWLEFASLQDTLEYRVGVREPTHILIKVLPLSSNPQHEMIAIDTLNIPGDHWLYACSANEFDGTKKFWFWSTYNHENTSIVSIGGGNADIHVRASLTKTDHVDICTSVNRFWSTYNHENTSIVSIGGGNADIHVRASLTKTDHVDICTSLSLSQEKPQLVHTLVLDDMHYVWLAARVRMIPRCDPSQKYPQSVATVRVPWSNQNTRYVIWRNVSSHTFPVTLYDPKPKDLYDPKPKDLYDPKPKDMGEEEGVSITFELDPNCQYLVTLQLSYWDSVSAFIFSYTPMLLSHVAAILLFLLAYQLVELDSSGSCSMFHLALAHSGANPISVLMGVKVLTTLVWVVQYGGPFVLPQLSSLLPNLSPDTAQLYAQDLDALIIPGLLYSMALSCVVLTGAVGLVSIVLWGKTMNTLAINFLAKLLHGSTLYSEWTMKILEKIPGLVAALMLSIAYNTCGGLAFALGFCMYFLKLVLLYEDIFEKLLFLPLNVLRRYVINKLKRYRRSRLANSQSAIDSNQSAISSTGNNQSAIQNTNQSASDNARANNRSAIQNINQSAIDNRALDQPAIGNTDGPIALPSTSNEPIALPSTSNDGPIALPSTSNGSPIALLANPNDAAVNDQPMVPKVSGRLLVPTALERPVIVREDSPMDDEDEGASNGSPIALLANPNDAAVNDQPMVPKVSGRLLVPTALERPVIVREDSPIDDEDEGVSFRDLNFHFTLFLLWLIPTLLSFPSTLVWAKTFGDTMQLSPDPISTYAVIMSLCAALLWQTELPKPNADYYLVVSNLVYLAGCYILLYAQTSLYRIIPAICFVFVVVCSHQLITSVFGLDKPQDEEWESEARDV
ncbi:LOW QUALITY PROTEIN: GPI inositol-deacylase [Diaphorina citri]|uniref:GPI inositol-deacylase n=1 Tax=Diaphorina citri TaxID=121845 RepID=A0A3Q0J458_DIACI|nr:LOW QUALITY PROTEIN: GPI inositol-deacylase [Diaphorina citri]